MKITKLMLKRAEREHFNKEDLKSLVKLHALSYLHYKQKGDLKSAKRYLTGKDVKKLADKIESRKMRKKSIKKAIKGVFGVDFIAKETKIF